MCMKDVVAKDRLKCKECGGAFHWQCYCTPEGMFPNRLRRLGKPYDHTAGNVARPGDTRRADFRCPRCNFKRVMRRRPEEASAEDGYVGLLDVRVTLGEYISDSHSYSDGCMYSMRKMHRWGVAMDVPAMVARDVEELGEMDSEHRQVMWYLADITRGVTWETAKKHRAALYNYYERMGLVASDIPTATTRFTRFMAGHLQRKGMSTTQNKVFTGLLIRAMTRYLEDKYRRAVGEERVRMAQVNLVWHAYLQTGARANELMEQKMGAMVAGFCFRGRAKRKRLRAHMKFRATLQTKEERFSETELLCCYRTKHAPLRAGMWAEIVVAERGRVDRAADDGLVFADPNGAQWKMGRIWHEDMLPALEQLQHEKAGGLEGTDLSAFGSNSFRRTWASLAAQQPDVVSDDLIERQGRWRKKSRKRKPGRMVSLYRDPKPSELLLASYWL